MEIKMNKLLSKRNVIKKRQYFRKSTKKIIIVAEEKQKGKSLHDINKRLRHVTKDFYHYGGLSIYYTILLLLLLRTGYTFLRLFTRRMLNMMFGIE